jgi:hypothetical protein
MVHASELRIGNKLWYCKPDSNELAVITITGLAEKEGIVQVQSKETAPVALPTGVRPITLTAEILEACGFQKDEIEYIGSLWHLHPVQLLDDNGLWLVNDKLRKRLKVHCLHQLQNLYFALSGKELEVSMKQK